MAVVNYAATSNRNNGTTSIHALPVLHFQRLSLKPQKTHVAVCVAGKGDLSACRRPVNASEVLAAQ